MNSGETIKKIGFVLENCDYIEIDSVNIGQFLITDIDESYGRMACNVISFDMCKTAKKVCVEIFKDADCEYNELGIDEFKTTKFNRLSLCDITQIVLIGDKGTEKTFFVEWGENEYSNEYQDVYLSKNNNLYIVIGKDICVESEFNLDNINNNDYKKWTV